MRACSTAHQPASSELRQSAPAFQTVRIRENKSAAFEHAARRQRDERADQDCILPFGAFFHPIQRHARIERVCLPAGPRAHREPHLAL